MQEYENNFSRKPLLKIEQDENGELVVSAKELHEYFDTDKSFGDWIQDRIDYGFKDGLQIKLNSDLFLEIIAKESYDCKDVSKLKKLLPLYEGDRIYLKDALFSHLFWIRQCENNRE